jgi:hypothetical protein
MGFRPSHTSSRQAASESSTTVRACAFVCVGYIHSPTRTLQVLLQALSQPLLGKKRLQKDRSISAFTHIHISQSQALSVVLHAQSAE